MKAERLNVIIELKHQRLTNAAIASRVGLSEDHVSRLLRSTGIKFARSFSKRKAGFQTKVCVGCRESFVTKATKHGNSVRYCSPMCWNKSQKPKSEAKRKARQRALKRGWYKRWSDKYRGEPWFMEHQYLRNKGVTGISYKDFIKKKPTE